MDALISAAAVLLGALIGLAGVQLTYRQNVKFAREQRRVERVQEMQSEAIPKLYMLLTVHKDEFEWVLNLPSRWTEETRKEITEAFWEGGDIRVRARLNQQVNEWEARAQTQVQAFVKQREEFEDYFALHGIWLPKSLSEAMEKLVQQYEEHGMKVREALKEWWGQKAWRASGGVPDNSQALEAFKEEIGRELDSYEAQVRETREWLRGDGRKLQQDLRSAAREVLAVEDYVRGVGGTVERRP
jgi:hypothetical protein